ncbi:MULTISPECIES: alpha/beta fold hydrolase [Roseomonadaceae]|uniref:Alpha/beta hydrolase n=1 Tax=Falsiroseomonas oleicola TaxID=2801474 RepID=A0ABS6H7P1_9PROT|nr:hypothetical protein [Roseomonas oleicola]MBU8544713.1 hypothetical protein [Roseomonas oleicola]
MLKMAHRFVLSLLASASIAGADGHAQTPPLLDSARVPHVGEGGRADYRRFLLQATPRAFALSENGAWGWASAIEPDLAATEARALGNCAAYGGSNCRIYARDLDVLGPEPAPAPTPPADPLAGGPGWALVPDGRFLWQGPQAARGAYLWAHGRAAGGADSRGSQPQPHARAFNNAGYDVLRLDRDPDRDETAAGAERMRAALAELRARGYARVVAAGQSRGAWDALAALDAPGRADAVIAIAPAAHGPTGSIAHAWALDDLSRVITAARAPTTRVAIATFAGDEYAPDPPGRAAAFARLAPRTGALLLLDRPAGLEGHGAGADWRFTLRYAACLLDFAEGRRATC